MGASPCFVNCGKPACKTLGCVRVYNDRDPKPGLPLTTGEGNTADELRAKLDALKSSETPVVDQADVERWLFNHAEDLVAECARLREQLDAVDDVLIKAIGDVTGLSMAGWDSERRWLGQVALARLEAARAALEAVGRADTGNAASAREEKR